MPGSPQASKPRWRQADPWGSLAGQPSLLCKQKVSESPCPVPQIKIKWTTTEQTIHLPCGPPQTQGHAHLHSTRTEGEGQGEPYIL